MKVKKWIDMGSEVQVEIGIEEVREALGEAFSVVTQDRLGEPGPNRAEIFMALNDIAIFLKAITDTQISMMTFGQLDKISQFLKVQRERFQAPLDRQAEFERGSTPATSKQEISG